MSMHKHTLLILGCGWLGSRVAELAIARGWKVTATLRNPEKAARLQAMGCQVVLLDFDKPQDFEGEFKEVDFVLNSIPATKRIEMSAVARRFDNLGSYLNTIKYNRQIFLSSIGIYPNRSGVLTEQYADELDEKLLLAEEKMLTFPHTSVFRLGGLMGENRILGKYFQNKICTTGDERSNLIHQEDAARMILQAFLHQDELASVYNVVSPEHPYKKDVIISSAKKYGFELPASFQGSQPVVNKVVDGSKLQRELSYSFLFSDPLEF